MSVERDPLPRPWPFLSPLVDKPNAPMPTGSRRTEHPVGAADDCAPDSSGCCGCTVTARCIGCPYAESIA